MEKIDGGYYIKARCIQNSEIAIMPPYIREIWDWLLKEANHTDNKSNGITILRGQLVRTFKDIQEGLHWMIGYRKMTYKKWQCENAMKFLRKRGMITTLKTTRGMFITILKYSFYQNSKNYENNKKVTTKATVDKQLTDTINKNVKNDNNVKKNTSIQKQKINFDFDKEIWENITDKDKKGWEEAYPACDIDMEIIQMKEWLLSNPDKKKSRYRRFITNWLSHSQDRGGSKEKMKGGQNGGSKRVKQNYEENKSRKKDKYKELYEV